MSLPPPPDPFGSPSPRNGGGGQQWGGPPQQGPGGQPPYVGGQPPEQQGPPIHHGQPPQMPPPPGQHGAPPPSWAPQQQWSGGPPPPPAPPAPPSKGGKGKWILVGLALIAVIALSVVGTVLVLRPESNSNAGDGDNGGGNPPTSATSQNGKSEFASANDTGPVNIIAEDPTCDAWGKISREYSSAATGVNWGSRDRSLPASAWTPEQRSMYDAVSKGMGRAAEQTENLFKATPHRVMRELYGQFIAYADSFVALIPNYVARDGDLGVAVDTVATTLSEICTAAINRVSAQVAPLVSIPEEPSVPISLSDTYTPSKLLTEPSDICSEWETAAQRFDDDTVAWRDIDPQIPASEWSPEQRAVNDAVAPVMLANADEMERIGRSSGETALEDIAVLAAQYRRAYVATLDNYVKTDNYLATSAMQLARVITWGCKVAAA